MLHLCCRVSEVRLTYIHLILTVDREDKLFTAEQMNEVISAELPNSIQDPSLFEIISTA